MIIDIYKDITRFIFKYFKAVFVLAVLLTPATIIDSHFESLYNSTPSFPNFFLSCLMEIISSIIGFLVLSHLYIYWQDNKETNFFFLIASCLNKFRNVIASYIWLIIFILIPFGLLWLINNFMAEIFFFKLDKSQNLTSILYNIKGSYNVIVFFILLISGYILIKLSFLIYFAYKAGARFTGIGSFSKLFKINFIEVLQYILALAVYFIFYHLIFYIIGYIIGAGSMELGFNYNQLLSADGKFTIFDLVLFFIVTILNIPFEIIYIAFAHYLYKKYTQ